jgi:hypothetical protein
MATLGWSWWTGTATVPSSNSNTGNATPTAAGTVAHPQVTGRWIAGPFVAALGLVRPAAGIVVEYGGRFYRRRGNEFGVWGFIHSAESARRGELPAVTLAEAPPG